MWQEIMRGRFSAETRCEIRQEEVQWSSDRIWSDGFSNRSIVKSDGCTIIEGLRGTLVRILKSSSGWFSVGYRSYPKEIGALLIQPFSFRFLRSGVVLLKDVTASTSLCDLQILCGARVVPVCSELLRLEIIKSCH